MANRPQQGPAPQSAPAAQPAVALAGAPREDVRYTRLPIFQNYLNEQPVPWEEIWAWFHAAVPPEDKEIVAFILTGNALGGVLQERPDVRIFLRFLHCLRGGVRENAWWNFFRNVYYRNTRSLTHTSGLVPVFLGIREAHEGWMRTQDRRPAVIDFARFLLAGSLADLPRERSFFGSNAWALIDRFPRLKKIAADKKITDREVEQALGDLPIATSLELLAYLQTANVRGQEQVRVLNDFIQQVQRLVVHRLVEEVLTRGQEDQILWRLDPTHVVINTALRHCAGNRPAAASRLEKELRADKAFLDAIKEQRRGWFKGSLAEFIVGVGAASEFLELFFKDIPEWLGKKPQPNQPQAPAAPQPSAAQGQQQTGAAPRQTPGGAPQNPPAGQRGNP